MLPSSRRIRQSHVTGSMYNWQMVKGGEGACFQSLSGDGSCLFHSLSYGLSGQIGNKQVSKELRMDIANFIRKHPEHKIAGIIVAGWVHLYSELSHDYLCNKTSLKLS